MTLHHAFAIDRRELELFLIIIVSGHATDRGIGPRGSTHGDGSVGSRRSVGLEGRDVGWKVGVRRRWRGHGSGREGLDLSGCDGLRYQGLVGGHPVEHIGHGGRVRHALSGLGKDWTRQARVGGRFGQISSLLRTVVVVASHLVVLRHRGVVRKLGLLVCLWHILRNPELVDVLLVCRQIVGEGHLVLSVHVTAGHVHHGIAGSDVGHSECAAQWGSRSSTLHWEAMVIVGMLVPPR